MSEYRLNFNCSDVMHKLMERREVVFNGEKFHEVEEGGGVKKTCRDFQGLIIFSNKEKTHTIIISPYNLTFVDEEKMFRAVFKIDGGVELPKLLNVKPESAKPHAEKLLGEVNKFVRLDEVIKAREKRWVRPG